MTVPVITSVTFDKASYKPGDTATATVNYSVPAAASAEHPRRRAVSTSQAFSVAATVVNDATQESASLPASFTVTDGAVAPVTGTAALLGGQPGQTWTKVSDNKTSQAVFTSTVLPLGGGGGGGNPVIITDPGGSADFDYAAQPGWTSWPNHGGAQVMQGVQQGGNPPFTSQVLAARSLASWSVAASIAAGNKSVVSYPATQNWLSQSDGGPIPLSRVTALTSQWAVTVPAAATGDIYEAAYDLWSQGVAAYKKAYGPIETMIWTWNHGQTPAGTKQAAVATIGGVAYDLWIRNDSSGQTYTLVMRTPALSGTVDLLAVFQWLIANKHLDADTGIFGLDFGFEICSTSGVAKTFAVTNLTQQAAITGA